MRARAAAPLTGAPGVEAALSSLDAHMGAVPDSPRLCLGPGQAGWCPGLTPISHPAACRGSHFGPGCALRCDCEGGADCDPVSGQCHCVDGYMGPTCRAGESGLSWRGRKTQSPLRAHPSPQHPGQPERAQPSLPSTQHLHTSLAGCEPHGSFTVWRGPWCHRSKGTQTMALCLPARVPAGRFT